MQQAVKTAPVQTSETPKQTAKQPLSENRRLAIRVAAVIVAFSLLVMGPVKLKSLRNTARDVFKNGTESDIVISVYNDIERSAAAAVSMANSAEILLGSNDAGVKQLRELAEKIHSETDEKKLLEAFVALKGASDNVYARYQNTKTDDKLDIEMKKNRDTVNSCYNTISKDSYFSYADRFNDALDGFPANLMGLISGLHKLPASL